MTKILETLFFVVYYLDRTCGFHFQCISIDSFCRKNVFWISKIRCISKNFSYFRRIRLKLLIRICWKHGVLRVFYLLGWKFADLMFFRNHKVKCERKKNRARHRRFACPTTPDWHQANHLSSPVIWSLILWKSPLMTVWSYHVTYAF